MPWNNAAPSDPAYKQQHQSSRCSLPSIPHDLVQPLRDALPKIDEALLSSVPIEAIPLCQQLFNAWLSTNTSNDITRPPRAKTTMNIASLCIQPSPPLLPRKEQQEQQEQHPYRQQNFAQTSLSLEKPNQCRKSQSTSRLSSWFSWSFAKRRNPTVVPMDLDKKKSAHQNISDFAPVNATTPTYSKEDPFLTPATTILSSTDLSYQQTRSHTLPQRPQPPALPQRPQSQHPRLPQGVHHHTSHQYTQSHEPLQQKHHHPPELSPSLSSSSSTTTSTSATYLSRTSQKPNDNNATGYRRSFSFMLSKLGTKVRRVIQSSSQSIHPQLKSTNISGTTRPLSQLNPPSSSTNVKQPTSPSIKDSPSISSCRKLNTSTSVDTNVIALEKHSDNTSYTSSSHTVGLIKPTDDHADIIETQKQHHDTAKPDWKELSFGIPHSTTSTCQEGPSFFSTMYQELDDDDYSDYSEDNDNDDDYISEDTIPHTHSRHYDDYGTNLKTPWSPPSSLARRTIKSSKTDTNMKNELSVPFIKMGLGRRRSVDVEDQFQYTTRSMSSTSFALQWQEKFHDQQQPRERIIGTLKSVSLTLYEIIRQNHAYQQFNSDTAYVAHPNFDPGRNTKELFATVPMTHWRDIFDQIAYIYDNGVLTAEHAIITMIYIERMLENSKQHLCEANWRLIVLAGLITSIKVWDDCAVYNMDFVHIFPELDIKHINLLERRFLEHIDWDVSVRCSLFASTYFELREHR